MKLIEQNFVLKFIDEEGDSAETLKFIDFISNYKLVRNGSGIHVYKDEQLLLFMLPCDRTVMVLHPEGYAVAQEFGAKRFIIDKALQMLSENVAEEIGAQHFTRDREFPITLQGNESNLEFSVVDLEGLEKIYLSKQKVAKENKQEFNSQQMYLDLAHLFRMADFTPGKQKEYTEQELQDKYCRFNRNNIQDAVAIEHIFLIKNNVLMGTISAAIYNNDIYFYDEIVDYAPNETEAKDQQELRRFALLQQLFTAARKVLHERVPDLEERIQQGHIHAFIRVAEDRKTAYENLGCSIQNNSSWVIHGAPRVPLLMADDYLKQLAADDLEMLKQKTNVNFPVITSISSSFHYSPKSMPAPTRTPPNTPNLRH